MSIHAPKSTLIAHSLMPFRGVRRCSLTTTIPPAQPRRSTVRCCGTYSRGEATALAGAKAVWVLCAGFVYRNERMTQIVPSSLASTPLYGDDDLDSDHRVLVRRPCMQTPRRERAGEHPRPQICLDSSALTHVFPRRSQSLTTSTATPLPLFDVAHWHKAAARRRPWLARRQLWLLCASYALRMTQTIQVHPSQHERGRGPGWTMTRSRRLGLGSHPRAPSVHVPWRTLPSPARWCGSSADIAHPNTGTYVCGWRHTSQESPAEPRTRSSNREGVPRYHWWASSAGPRGSS